MQHHPLTVGTDHREKLVQSCQKHRVAVGAEHRVGLPFPSEVPVPEGELVSYLGTLPVFVWIEVGADN